jgi:hypothetical protein
VSWEEREAEHDADEHEDDRAGRPGSRDPPPPSLGADPDDGADHESDAERRREREWARDGTPAVGYATHE